MRVRVQLPLAQPSRPISASRFRPEPAPLALGAAAVPKPMAPTRESSTGSLARAAGLLSTTLMMGGGGCRGQRGDAQPRGMRVMKMHAHATRPLPWHHRGRGGLRVQGHPPTPVRDLLSTTIV